MLQDPRILASQSNEILTAIVQGMRKEEQSNRVKLAATKALLNSLEFTKANFEKEVLHFTVNLSLSLFPSFLSLSLSLSPPSTPTPFPTSFYSSLLLRLSVISSCKLCVKPPSATMFLYK